MLKSRLGMRCFTICLANADFTLVFINIVAGIIIGMVQNHLSFADASETYTRLTVGDGLVSQIPALIVSVAAGILVSKAGMTDSTDKVLFEQVANYPKALGMSAFLALALGMLPGTPAIPFVLLAALTGSTAYYLDKQSANRQWHHREQTWKHRPWLRRKNFLWKGLHGACALRLH